MVFSKCNLNKIPLPKDKVLGILLGQLLSLLITATGVSSQLLASNYGIAIPTTQSCFNYALLTLYVFYLIYQRGISETGQVVRKRWYLYVILSAVDVEANYLAYQYTNITSVMLLDCFTIPCVMIMSRLFLKTRFHLRQYLAVILCLMGLVILILSDYFYNPKETGIFTLLYPNFRQGSDPVTGDILCLAGAFLYAVSNVSEEALVKKNGRTEWLSFIGIGGTIISGAQLAILERHELETLQWDWKIAGLLAAFALTLFFMYSFTPYMMVLGSATVFNLSLLTSDVYAIIISILMFDAVPSFLYFIAFVVIVGGLILYNVQSKEEEYAEVPEEDENTIPTSSVELTENSEHLN